MVDLEKRSRDFVGQAQRIVQILRYGPRELILALFGVSLIVLGRLPSPELLDPVWKWLTATLTLLGLGFLVWSFWAIWKKVVAPLPVADESRPSVVKGAAAFGPQDSEVFSKLGCDRELARLRGWVLDDQVPLVAVYGESGVGKTSLLRSGLPHELTSDDLTVIYWEALPTDSKARLLRSVQTQWRDPGSPPETLEGLVGASSNGRTAHPSRSGDIFDTLPWSTYFVGPG